MNGHGAWDRLAFADVDEPMPGADECLVQVHAAALGPRDLDILAGDRRLGMRVELPLVLGHEISGTILRVGPSVTRLRAGDAIMARLCALRLGALAQRCVVKESAAALKPTTLSFEEAAGVPYAALTALACVRDALDLRRTETLLVHVDAGMVGAWAIQFAKEVGAKVVVLAPQGGGALARQLGADVILDASQSTLEAMTMPIDAVLDTLGAEALASALRAVKSGGRVVSVAGVPAFANVIGGKDASEKAQERASESGLEEKQAPWHERLRFWHANRATRALAASRGVTHSFVFVRPDATQLADVAAGIDGGRYVAPTERVYEFHRAIEALRYLALGKAQGKVVVSMPIGWRQAGAVRAEGGQSGVHKGRRTRA